MDSKLTLKLDDAVIEKAKKFAAENKISLSRMIENYLISLTDEHHSQRHITPLVRSLSGIIQIPDDGDIRQNYRKYLSKKYAS